ncbi:hypothetical protein GCM10025868_02670 [Angustibacter aerolatus]|uniref:Uncharacterized protein n=1 Tax=Angustibacter aerolatus TaxID=1162965 RepID=A0ABQ6JA08_9ACTN|nr:hypothetical protein GCM10025868_02670 [Angustibacter aerolatus]
MLAAGAADADRDVALALGLVPRDDRLEALDEPVEEDLRAALGQHERAHRLVEPRLRAQAGHPVRVRQEPHVDHEVGVERHPVLEPERHHGGAQQRQTARLEHLRHLRAQAA